MFAMMGVNIGHFNLSRSFYVYMIKVLIATVIVAHVSASVGDRSNEFRACLYVCRFNNCSQEFSQDPYYNSLYDHTSSIELSLTNLLHRTCTDDCRYHCMWQTTNIFLNEKRGIPQFYGKWPFTRIFGFDEPASVIFSLLNLVGHCYGLYKFMLKVPSSTPMHNTWQLYSLVCINTWLWSAVFHARDLPITERLDYFSAFAMVLFNLYALCLRVVGPGRDHIKQSVGAAAFAFFIYHVWHLNKRFDYGYNMKVNVSVGVCNGIGWLIWCYMRRSREYVHLCVWVMLICAGGMVLELADFPPIGWFVDAHALWHLITAPLCLPWYKFVIADCHYMLDQENHRYRRKRIRDFID